MATKLFDYPEIEGVVAAFKKLSEEDAKTVFGLFSWLHDKGAIYLILPCRLRGLVSGWHSELAYRKAKELHARALTEFQKEHGRIPETPEEDMSVHIRAYEMVDELP